MIREKHTKSGKLLEVDFYPVFSDGRAMPARKPKTKPSTAAQAKYNHIKSMKKAVRIINANFDNSDLYIHTTYEDVTAPITLERAERDFDNFKRRFKRARARELKRVEKLLEGNPCDKRLLKQRDKLSEPLKYDCRIEEQIYKSGKHKGKSNFHFHIFMTGGLDRDLVESLWIGNSRVNANRFQPEKFGPESAARYGYKEMDGKSKTMRSRNMIKPTERVRSDGRITKRGVQRLACLRSDDKEYWEKRHKGYKFLQCYPRYNEYNGHWYVSVVMYRTDEQVSAGGMPKDWIVWE